MTSGRAGTHSKIILFVLGVALAALLPALAAFGPDLAICLWLNFILPPGTDINYERTGGFGDSIGFENLSLAGETFGRLTIDRAEISGPRLLNLLKGRPGLDLAESLDLWGLAWEGGGWSLAARSLEVVRPRFPAAETDHPFHSLALSGPQGEGAGLPAGPRFKMDRLVLIDADAALDGLSFEAETGAGHWSGEIERLALKGFMTALDRWLQSGGRPLSLAPELFHLNIDSGELALDGRPALKVTTFRPERNFILTKFSSEAVSHSCFLEFTFIPSALEGVDPFWPNLAGLTGEPLDFELSLELTFDPQGRAVQVRGLSLDSPSLGRLDLAGELSGLGPGGDTAAECLAALYPARLHGLSLIFQDRGLLPGYYAWLAQAAGWEEAEVPARIKADLLDPLASALAEEGGLANLPDLAAAAEAFLDQPENIMISAEPPRPLALAHLVKMDRYDIIERLKMTMAVNDLPAIAVGVNLPRSSPRPSGE